MSTKAQIYWATGRNRARGDAAATAMRRGVTTKRAERRVEQCI